MKFNRLRVPASFWSYLTWVGLTLGLLWILWRRGEGVHMADGLDAWRFEWMWLGLAILLMPLNWGLEVRKYQVLLGEEKGGADWQALGRGVLAGIGLSLFLPHRMGDLAGRLVYLPMAQRAAGTSAGVVGSGLQWLWTGIWGLVGMLYLGAGRVFGHANGMNLAWGWWIAGLFLIALFGVYSPQARIWLREAWTHFKDSLAFGWVTRGLVYGLLRYGVYLLQYVFVLKSTGCVVAVNTLLAFAAFVFLCQSLLPLPPALGWVGRLQIAVFCSGLAGISGAQALVASFFLWVVNLFLPGLFGWVMLIRHFSIKSFADGAKIRDLVFRRAALDPLPASVRPSGEDSGGGAGIGQ